MKSASIPLSAPHLCGNAERYLRQCVDENQVSSVGPFVQRFERLFAEHVGSRHAVACSSGTAAIHVALRLAGVGPGDEVLVSSFTFVASANPIRYLHAQPVFVDSHLATWNLAPDLVCAELERRARAGLRQPAAVEVVHVLGHPADVEPVAGACARFGVALIEDAAEALGARYTAGRFAGRHVGTIGRAGCFSFNGNKILTTGGGGMVVTDDQRLADRARHLTTQAKCPGLEYEHDEVGYNYRLTNLAAALGLAQLECLPDFVARKREIARRYDAALSVWPGVTLPPRAAWADPSLWLYSVLVDAGRFGADSRMVCLRLGELGIDTRPLWRPLHRQPIYAGCPRLAGEVAEGLHAQGLSLPCSVGLTDEQQDRVIAAFAACGGGR